jgi:hypothetical protein
MFAPVIAGGAHPSAWRYLEGVSRCEHRSVTDLVLRSSVAALDQRDSDVSFDGISTGPDRCE